MYIRTQYPLIFLFMLFSWTASSLQCNTNRVRKHRKKGKTGYSQSL